MATKTATVTIEINEPEGETTTSSVTFEYDNEDSISFDIPVDYIAEGTKGGPVMRPNKPRF